MRQPITIIGGNIAGLSAAYYLARKGCPVIVYENKIWNKPCGGAISIEYAHYLINKLGVDINAVNQFIHPVHFHFTNHHTVETDGLFVIISRYDLQQQLINRLQKKSNINIRFKRITLKNDDLLSGQTVLATGFSGFTRQVIGNQWHEREYALTLKYTGHFQALPPPGQRMFFDSRLKGYGWLFCDNNSQFNIGIGGLIEKEIIFQKFEKLIKTVNDKFHYDIRPARSPNIWKIPIMLNNWKAPVSFDKNGIEFIGAGDVLGLAHPIIAAGIEPAWQSGWLLGESYDPATHTINTTQYRHLLKKNLQLTSRKPLDILISNMLRINCFPFKDQLSYFLMKLFHKKIIKQIKNYPWFAMVHDGNKKTGLKLS